MDDCGHYESLAILQQLPESFTSQTLPPHFYENLPAIPLPNPDPEENAFLHHDIGEQVGKTWNLLNGIVIRHEPDIRSGWDKRSAKRRHAILLEAWGEIMPEMYRPDFRWFLSAIADNQIVSDKNIAPEEVLFLKGSKKHTALVYPYINQEHLIEKKALPLFINSRGRAGPNEFLHFNVEATNLGRATRELQAPNLQGFRIDIDNEENYAEIIPSESTFHNFNLTAGEILFAMKIHDRVMKFLIQCCLLILNRTDPQDLLSAPILPDVPCPRKLVFPDIASINWEAPFVKPMDFDHRMVMDYLVVRRSAAEDHIWDLRENPGYFAATVVEWSEHVRERMNFPDEVDVLKTGTPKFWNTVISEAIAHAFESLVTWNQLFVHFSLIHERAKDDHLALSWFRRMPGDCAEQLHIFNIMLDKIATRLIGTLWRGSLVSPHNRQIWRSFLGPQARPTTENYKLNGNLDRVFPPPGISTLCTVLGVTKNREPNLLTLTRLMHPLSRDIFGYRNLVDDMGIQFVVNPMENLRMSAWSQRMFSDLGLISKFKKEVDKHQTFCDETPFLSGKDYLCTSAAANENLSLLTETRNSHRCYKRLADLGTPIKGRFDYPMDQPRTQEVIKRMQESERNLQAFWKKADEEYKKNVGRCPLVEMGGMLEFSFRQIWRTPDWVEPEKNGLPKEICKKKVSPIEEIQEKGVAKKKKKKKGGKNSQKLLEDKSLGNLEKKMGSDDVAQTPGMSRKNTSNLRYDSAETSDPNLDAEVEAISASECFQGPQQKTFSQTENDTIQAASPANRNEQIPESEQIPITPTEDEPTDKDDQIPEHRSESNIADTASQSEAEQCIVQLDDRIGKETNGATETTAALNFDEQKATAEDVISLTNQQETDCKTEAESVCVEAEAVGNIQVQALEEESTDHDHSIASSSMSCGNLPDSSTDNKPNGSPQIEDEHSRLSSIVDRGRSLSACSESENVIDVQFNDTSEIENEYPRPASNPFRDPSTDSFIEQANEYPGNLIRAHSPDSWSDIENYTEVQPIYTQTENENTRMLGRECSTDSSSKPGNCIDFQPRDTQEDDQHCGKPICERSPDYSDEQENYLDFLASDIQKKDEHSSNMLLDHPLDSPNKSDGDFEAPPTVNHQTENEHQKTECTVEVFRPGFSAMMCGAIYYDPPLRAESFTQTLDSEYRKEVCPRRAALDALITDKPPVEGPWNQINKKTDDEGGTGCVVNALPEDNGTNITPPIVSSSMVFPRRVPLEHSTADNSQPTKASSPAASIRPSRLAQIGRIPAVNYTRPNEAKKDFGGEPGTVSILANGFFEENTLTDPEDWWSRALDAHKRSDPFANFLEYPYHVPGRPRGKSVPTLFNIFNAYQETWRSIIENEPVRRASYSLPNTNHVIEETYDPPNPPAEWNYVGYIVADETSHDTRDIETSQNPPVTYSPSTRSRSRSNSLNSDVSHLNLNETARPTNFSTNTTVSSFGSPDLGKLVPVSAELAALYEEIRVLKEQYVAALAYERAQQALEELAALHDRDPSVASSTANSRVEEQANTSTDEHGSSETDNHDSNNDTPDSSTFGDLPNLDDSKHQQIPPSIAVPWNLVGVRRGKRIPTIKWPTKTDVLENNPYRQLQEIDSETGEVAMDHELSGDEMKSNSVTPPEECRATNGSVDRIDPETIQNTSPGAWPASNAPGKEEDVFFDTKETFPDAEVDPEVRSRGRNADSEHYEVEKASPNADEAGRDAKEKKSIDPICTHDKKVPQDALEHGQERNAEDDTSFNTEEPSIDGPSDKLDVKLDCPESTKKKSGKSSKKSGSAKKKSSKALKNKSAEEFDEILNELKDTTMDIDNKTMPKNETSQQSDDKLDYEVYYLTNISHKVMTALYHVPVKNQPLPSFSWTEFVTAMEEMGFTPRHEHATLWHFCLGDMGLGVQIHQPIGALSKKVPYDYASYIGRRFNRQYGYVKESFIRQEDCEDFDE